ncbi:helix-turn-helix domain-containing protein [Neolewinella sp.]|uniref:helix-turn-helix domain-containing protein n=1 Tax=Neolewinella sp. TaxID=2993543 RepID=UPI003B51CA1F
MNKQDIYIDNMVCDRCILAVRQVVTNLGWRIERLQLGRLTGWPPDGHDEDALVVLGQQLHNLGFRLREGHGGTVSRIKGLIVAYVYNDRADTSHSLSDLISADIGQSYSHLSRMFSQEEGRTIVDFYRIHRIERGKQLLIQTDEPVSAITGRLNYGSAGRFAAVFKQDTGMSPTAFRARGRYVARPLDEL